MRGNHTESVAGAATDGDRRLTIILTSNDMDKVWAALILAVGAASSGLAVSMFFSFWGLSVLRKRTGAAGHMKKPLLERMFGLMLPKGPGHLKLSKMNMAGLGPKVFRHVARLKNIASPIELLDTARELGVRLVACQMTMDMMGLRREEMIEGVESGGVATCLGDACHSKATLFI
jgi:peroxiredoxin family protein